MKMVKSPCVKLGNGRALLAFHADQRNAGFPSAVTYLSSDCAPVAGGGTGERERSILFGWLNSVICRKSWVSQDAALSLSVTSRSGEGGRPTEILCRLPCMSMGLFLIYDILLQPATLLRGIIHFDASYFLSGNP